MAAAMKSTTMITASTMMAAAAMITASTMMTAAAMVTASTMVTAAAMTFREGRRRGEQASGECRYKGKFT
jgi:hypothetical protein